MAKSNNKSEVKRTPVKSSSTSDIIKDIAQSVNKSLKKDVLTVGGEASEGDLAVPYWVRTGIPQLDYSVGGYTHPGFPAARLIEIFGAEGCGKSTLAVWLTKMAMEQEGALAYYQDAERVLTPEIIRGTGIEMSQVILEQPEILEEVFDSQESVLKVISEKYSDRPAVVTLDSIAACSTKAEVEGDMEDMQVASHARLMSKGLRKIKGFITDNNVLSIWVNQVREKIGVSWGDNTTTAGGKAMKFYASVRVKLTKTKTLKKGDEVYGCTIQAKIEKNKVAPPLKVASYDILFVQDENGSYPLLDINGAVLDWLKDMKLIGGSSGRYEINGKSYYKEQARSLMSQDEELRQELIELAYSIKCPPKLGKIRADEDDE